MRNTFSFVHFKQDRKKATTQTQSQTKKRSFFACKFVHFPSFSVTKKRSKQEIRVVA